MDWVRLGSISSEIEFTQIAELNRTQSMDWDWLSLIFERSIYYAGIKKNEKKRHKEVSEDYLDFSLF